MTRIVCPKCRRKYPVAEDDYGTTFRCRCGHPISVPLLDEDDESFFGPDLILYCMAGIVVLGILSVLATWIGKAFS